MYKIDPASQTPKTSLKNKQKKHTLDATKDIRSVVLLQWNCSKYTFSHVVCQNVWDTVACCK